MKKTELSMDDVGEVACELAAIASKLALELSCARLDVPPKLVTYVHREAAQRAMARYYEENPAPPLGLAAPLDSFAALGAGVEQFTEAEQRAILRRMKRMAQEDIQEDELLGRDGSDDWKG